MKIAIHLLLVIVCCYFSGCKRYPEGVMNDKELKLYVEANLKSGDPKEKIEQFFKDNNWNYGYNRFDHRYSAHYKPGDVNTWFEMSGVGVRVYIDEKGLLERIEVDRAYTGL